MDAPRINYIIASTPSTIPRRARDSYTAYVLQYHLRILSQVLKKSSHIRQITLVKQESDFDIETSEKYYDVQRYLEKISKIGIAIETLEVPKQGISYTQYLRAYEKFPDFDYYIIMEDDWTINLEHRNFDKTLLKSFSRMFPDDVGFLDCWSPRTGKYVSERGGFGCHPHHSAITVGMMSKEAMARIFHRVAERDLFCSFSQMHLSMFLKDLGVEIKDLPAAGVPTQILFWETEHNLIIDYTETPENETVPAMFVPVQHYYKEVTVCKDNVQKVVTNPRNILKQGLFDT